MAHRLHSLPIASLITFIFCFFTFFLAAAIFPFPALCEEEELIYELPSVYRGEVWSVLFSDPQYDDYYALAENRAYLGARQIVTGRVDKWMVWAEFDLSSLAGKKVIDVGFRVYNSGTAAAITDLAYSSIQPSTYATNAQGIYESYNYSRDSYIGFNWPINAAGTWEPGSDSFFMPGNATWKSWVRNGSTTILQDIQSRIDSGQSWFALVFSKFTMNPSATPNLNLVLPDTDDPQSIIMQVTVAEGLVKEKNLGNCSGGSKTCPQNGEPINMATGNEYRQETDLNIAGPGLPMMFQRHYNSQSDISSTLGYGWTSTFSEHLTVDTDSIKLHQSDGNEVHFIDDGQGGFISEADKKG